MKDGKGKRNEDVRDRNRIGSREVCWCITRDTGGRDGIIVTITWLVLALVKKNKAGEMEGGREGSPEFDLSSGDDF